MLGRDREITTNAAKPAVRGSAFIVAFDSIPFDMGSFSATRSADAFARASGCQRSCARMKWDPFSGGTAASGKRTMKLADGRPRGMKRFGIVLCG